MHHCHSTLMQRGLLLKADFKCIFVGYDAEWYVENAEDQPGEVVNCQSLNFLVCHLKKSEFYFIVYEESFT